MSKKNQPMKIKNSTVSGKESLNKMDVSIDNLEEAPLKSTIIGFDSDTDILTEINNRLMLVNKHTFLVKRIPKNLTRTSLKLLIPEMITCRIPVSTYSINKGFVFVQMKNDELVDKYVKIINDTKIDKRQLVAIKVKDVKPIKSLKECDLKTLYFNGLKSETKFNDVKEAFPNAKIIFPVNNDKSSQGSVTLIFKTDLEAKEAFAENKLTLNGIKVQLNYLLKDKIKEIFSYEKPEEIVLEIKKRFELSKDRSICIKNIGKDFTLNILKEMLPSLISCKINREKCLGFVNFDKCSSALEAVKQINEKSSGNKTMRAFIAKLPAFEFSDLSHFELESLHLSNLPMYTTVEDLERLFGHCAIDLPLNSDNSCTGSATLTFSTKEECLTEFSRKDLEIRGVAIEVNFRRIMKIENKSSKTVEKKSEKRKFVEDADEKLSKKMKTEDNEKVTHSTKPVKRKFEEVRDNTENEAKKIRQILTVKTSMVTNSSNVTKSAKEKKGKDQKEIYKKKEVVPKKSRKTKKGGNKE